MGGNLHDGHRHRMRKKYMEYGLDPFEDHEVLEMLLYYALPRKNTNDLSHKLINEFGSLSNLFEASPWEIMDKCKVSEYMAVLISMIPALAQRYYVGRWENKLELSSSDAVGKYAISLMMGKVNECFYILCLDNKKQLNHAALISEGTVDEAYIYPRRVVEAALKHKAVSVVLVHNHPSGLLIPSRSDFEATKRIVTALEPIEIQVMDHIIVAGNQYFSFAEKNSMVF